MTEFPMTPFGRDITTEDIVTTMQQFKGWEDKYRQVIQWGKKLPQMPEEYKTDSVTVSGCESKVWLVSQQVDGLWSFCADSDARIVRGLIALVLAAFDGKTTEQIHAFNVDGYFESLGLISHLSASRGNGLKAIVEKIQSVS